MAKPKKQIDSTAEKIERTGERTFNVKHDDGSVFECVVDDPKKFNQIKGMAGTGNYIGGFPGIGEKKPLICDGCKKQVYRLRSKPGTPSLMYCNHCL